MLLTGKYLRRSKMANRRPQDGRRRMDFHSGDRGKNFGRSGVSPWQGAGPSGGLPNLLPLSGVPTEATLALASNIINLLQPRQNPVPSLLDMPIRRDFGPDMGRYDRGYGPNRVSFKCIYSHLNYELEKDASPKWTTFTLRLFMILRVFHACLCISELSVFYWCVAHAVSHFLLKQNL